VDQNRIVDYRAAGNGATGGERRLQSIDAN
jgi:hypothetical protein